MLSLPIEKILFFIVLPSVVAISLIEAWVLSRRQVYDFKALGLSLLDVLLRNALNIGLPLTLATPLVNFAWENRIATLELDTWQAVALLFFGQEFCYYWFHRAAHRVRWFWCNHAVHHSTNQLNFGAALRTGLLGRATGNLAFFTPLIFLGFSPKTIALTYSINLVYQFWIHATWIPKLGWLEYVLNTPSSHRVHHAANLDYLDANYGGVLIVFDRLFGTYRAEDAAQPCRYGWVVPLASYNPLTMEFSQWAALARDLKNAPSLKAAVGYLVMPPGWTPDGDGLTTEALRRQAAPTLNLS